jgi:type IV pilus assembly protein PilC
VDFSVALGRYPRIFSRLFVAMVRASEASGTMGRMLQRVSRHLEQQRQIVRRVKGAMAYPLAMIGFCILVLTTIMTFVLPRFERIYADKAAVLPAPTRVLLGLTRGLATYWPHLLAGLVGVSLGVWLFCRRPASRPLLDGLRLRLPVLGKMFRKTCLARALRTLATMISAGVSLLESLEITAAVSGNVHYDRLWRTLAARLKEGRSLAEEMSGQPLLPRSLCQMVAAGERAGKLATVLDRVAGFCEEDLDTSIRTVTSFVEPAMVVIMGGIVGCIALALLLPVFSLSRIMVR